MLKENSFFYVYGKLLFKDDEYESDEEKDEDDDEDDDESNLYLVKLNEMIIKKQKLIIYCFFFLGFCPKIKFRNVHKMGHFRKFLKMYIKWGFFENFRKCTQNGKFWKMYTKWGIFEIF
jgi:hypothetical protein